MQFNRGKGFKQAEFKSRVVNFLFSEEDKQMWNGLHSGAPGGSLWMVRELEGELSSMQALGGWEAGSRIAWEAK